MTKTKYWLSLLAVSVVLIAGSIALSPIAIADNDDDLSELACPAENVQHWHSVNFVFGEANTQLVHDTLPTLDRNRLYWIQIESTEFDVIDFQSAITERLNEIGYRQLIIDTGDEIPIPQRIILPDDRNQIIFQPQMYDTICGQN